MQHVEMRLLKTQNLIGHCQLTYISKGQRLVYCLQDQGNGSKRIRLLRCTQDGEPNYEVSFTKVRARFERPEPDQYDSDYASELKRLCNEWIDEYENSWCEACDSPVLKCECLGPKK